MRSMLTSLTLMTSVTLSFSILTDKAAMETSSDINSTADCKQLGDRLPYHENHAVHACADLNSECNLRTAKNYPQVLSSPALKNLCCQVGPDCYPSKTLSSWVCESSTVPKPRQCDAASKANLIHKYDTRRHLGWCGDIVRKLLFVGVPHIKFHNWEYVKAGNFDCREEAANPDHYPPKMVPYDASIFPAWMHIMDACKANFGDGGGSAMRLFKMKPRGGNGVCGYRVVNQGGQPPNDHQASLHDLCCDNFDGWDDMDKARVLP